MVGIALTVGKIQQGSLTLCVLILCYNCNVYSKQNALVGYCK